ncbi:MAG: hypothetical protein JO166_00530 [Deltaproteobacteria bacterium]|nr:hypothetical protein [Deltaproteobacteria bacterium]
MIANGYGLQPAEVRMAVEWLKIREPDEAISLDKVIKLATHGGVRPSAGRPKSTDAANGPSTAKVAVLASHPNNQGEHSTLKKTPARTGLPVLIATMRT